MKLSAKQKKWIKRIGILVAIRIVLGALIYYAVVYRFRDIVQLALNIETKSAYDFDAGDIDVQLFKGKITMNNAFLTFRDSAYHITHHDVKIPEIQLEIESFRDLIFHGKLHVKNLAIIRPSLATTAATKNSSRSVSLHATNIIQALKKMTKHLNVDKFSLEDGSFSYKTLDSSRELVGSNISISLRDFSGKNLAQEKFLGTQELIISIKNQNWVLPDGKHEIGFKSLLLSVEKDILDIDSLTVSVRNGDTTNLKFFADRIIMKSGALMPSLEENNVTIDSVMVLHPVLDIGATGANRPKKLRNTDSIRYFLDQINIKYLDIIEGQVDYTANSGSLVSTDKANVEVFNFKLNSRADGKLTTDSIALSLHDIQFYSKDSLFKLNVGHCGFSGDHLNFEDVSFGPSEKNKSFRGLVFAAPAIQLKNIEPGDLIRKKITATQAFLIKPSIKYYRGKIRDTSTAMRSDHHTLMLANLHDIINVPEFHMIDGMLSIRNEARPEERITANHMNAFVLLNDFTGGESKQEMKAAIKNWSAQTMEIALPAIHLKVYDLQFSGEEQHSVFKSMDIILKNGTTVNAQHIIMDRLNADELLNQKKINLGRIKFTTAKVKLANNGNGQAEHKEKKTMPFYIGKIEVDNLLFESEGKNAKFLSLTGDDLDVEGFSNETGHIAWKKIDGDLFNIRQRSRNGDLTVDKIAIAHDLLTLKNLKLQNASGNNSNTVEIPELVVSTPRFKAGKPAEIASFVATAPKFVFIRRDSTSAPTAKVINLPEDITINNIRINNADVQYSDFSKKDTLLFSMNASIEMNALNVTEGRTPEISFKNFKATGSNANFSKGAITAIIPVLNFSMEKADITMQEKNKFKLVAATNIDWKDVQFSFNKSPNLVTAKTVAGSFNDPKFSFHSGGKLSVTELSKHFHLNADDIVYTYAEGSAHAANLSWNRQNNRSLTVNKFNLLPNKTWEEWVSAAKWQADYLTLKGESLVITNIDFDRNNKDSVLEIQKITASEVELTLKKDKRKPFHHGIDKGMPTELVSRIHFPLKVDTIQVKNSDVLVTQISEKTSKPGLIPVKNLNALVTGVSNKDDFQSLKIIASAEILDNHIRNFDYSEDYKNAGGFDVSAAISPMSLPSFNSVTVPLANIAIRKGHSDTLFANWKGNKYVALGTMNFYYNNLHINFLNKKNPEKKTLITRIENSLANLVIRNKNNGTTYLILSERDHEKFFITFWVKSLMSGMMTTAGLKSNKKYRKTYIKKRAEWQMEYPDYLK